MERKYYLRGLGIGIVMTAVIMGIAFSGKHKMTDEEIIERAKELGMVENTYLTDNAAGEEETPEEQNIEEANPVEEEKVLVAEPESPQIEGEDITQPTEPEEAEKEPIPVAEPVEEELIENESAEEDTNEMTRQEDAPSSVAKVQKVTIVSGDGSYTVALKLKEAGVVMSAETFDDFLCENGYDKKLRTGTFQIPTDASDEQIARIVTGQEE